MKILDQTLGRHRASQTTHWAVGDRLGILFLNSEERGGGGPMAEVDGEGVAIVVDSITLKTITLLLVGDTKLDSAPSLKAEHLLVDA